MGQAGHYGMGKSRRAGNGNSEQFPNQINATAILSILV